MLTRLSLLLPCHLLFLAAFTTSGPVAVAGEWRIERISDVRTSAIRHGRGGPFVRTDKGWHRATSCAETVCLERSGKPPRRAAPKDGLPDGEVASGSGRGLVRAWFAEPTRRYGHGVLGDAVEAGALIAESASGDRHVFRLPESAVFEDITPRLADLDNDGRAEVVAIRAFRDAGGSLGVYGLQGGKLREIARTAPIGRANRWLNVAGIADFDGDGTRDVAIVVTPHIGGTLEFWSLRKNRLVKLASQFGFSNHAIGSRNLNLSAVADVDGDGDGIADLAVPDASRRALQIVKIREGKVVTLASIRMPAMIAENMARMAGPDGPVFLLGLSDGSLVAVSRAR